MFFIYIRKLCIFFDNPNKLEKIYIFQVFYLFIGWAMCQYTQIRLTTTELYSLYRVKLIFVV